ncbi:MAG: patatin-like phospholipase family protein, partial [Chitinophagaceae bacterium]|nr:patatin-like phospholipase family protein [Chitinophagaceae bacterium]
YILFATVNGSFMQRFGAHMLFLYPEYLDKVTALSTFMVGGGYGVFVMCWNITTFILFSRYFRFLAATTQPFLKYCINNSILPILFLVFYLVKAVSFAYYQELLSILQILALSGGFLAGFAFVIAISFLYFFGADRTIYRRMPVQARQSLARKRGRNGGTERSSRIRIDWYLSATLRLRQPRNVSHYDTRFLESIFGQHHLAAIFSVLLVFAGLIAAGFFQDSIYLQLPSAGSIMVFFAILISVAGGFAYFLKAWAIPASLLFLAGLNFLYQRDILDPRNKAYGINYKTSEKPAYNHAALLAASSPEAMRADSLQYIAMLEQWKRRQGADKPTLTLIAVSGGGTRSAAFTINVLRTLDSSSGFQLMPSAFLISGASGGVLGAAWYRELYLRRLKKEIASHTERGYTDAITQDLLNPIFSSIVTRDLLAPAQFFRYNDKRYVRDRGYAFEQKLNRNTYGWMDKNLGDYAQPEAEGRIPVLLASAVITRDGRKLWMANHPVRFLTRPRLMHDQGRTTYPDGIDIKSFFSGQDPGGLRFLSVLRMNATFPYVLPNVWLPTQPVIDVMDAGFRDNTGLEAAMRFLHVFRSWIQANCGQVLLLQLRDKPEGGWDTPYESDNILDIVTKPALLTQNNLFRFQEYDQLRQWEWLQAEMGPLLKRVVFEYRPAKGQEGASLSFHLTRREKEDILQSLLLPHNQRSLQQARQLLQPAAKAPAGE